MRSFLGYISRLAMLLCCISSFLCVSVSCSKRVIVNMASKNHRVGIKVLKEISFCVDCPSPDKQGSIAYGLAPKHGVAHYDVTAELIYVLPNNANGRRLLNGHEIEDRIAFVDRGEINLYDKVINSEKCGALGVLIADDGKCNEAFSACGSRVGSVAEGGFAPHDEVDIWRQKIKIPVLLISLSTAERLRKAMAIRRINVPSVGWQNVSAISLIEEDEL